MYVANRSTKRAVLIALRENVNFVWSLEIPDANGLYLILLCTLNSVQFTFVNIYTQNKEQIRFLRTLLHQNKQVQTGNLLIGGDFKAIDDSSLDSTAHNRSFLGTLNPYYTNTTSMTYGAASLALKRTLHFLHCHISPTPK